LPKDEVVVYNQPIRGAWLKEDFRRKAGKRLGLFAWGSPRALEGKKNVKFSKAALEWSCGIGLGSVTAVLKKYL
jgi:hypothetical protein